MPDHQWPYYKIHTSWFYYKLSANYDGLLNLLYNKSLCLCSEPEYHTTDSDQHFVIEYDNEEGGGDGDEVAVAFAPPGFQAGQAPQQNEAQQEDDHRYWQL